MTARRAKALEELAHHEAGHAAMALWHRLPFDRVWIEDGEPKIPGAHSFGLALGSFEGLRTDSDWQAAEIAIAGPFASGLHRFGLEIEDGRLATWFNRQSVLGPFCTDICNVEQELTAHGWIDRSMPTRAVQKRMRQFELMTIPGVRVLWPDIQALAARILEASSLSRADCEKVISWRSV